LFLRPFSAALFVTLLVLSSAAALPLQSPALGGGNPPPVNTGISLEIHVANQYGVWYNGALVEVFDVNSAMSLVANGTTQNGEFFAGNLTYSTYSIQVYTTNGGQANQSVTLSTNSAIVNFVIPSPSPPALSLQNIKVNTGNAAPGTPFSVTADVVNTSNSTAYNTVLYVQPPAQFSLLNTGSNIVIGTLAPAMSESLTISLAVSSAATASGYALNYVLNFTDYAGRSYDIPGSISLSSPPPPILTIESVSLVPQIIQPGSTFSLTAVVVNSSNSTAFDAVLAITPPSQFSLLNAGSILTLGTLQPGANESLTLQLIASSSASSSSDTIAYSLIYTDYFLNKQTTTGSLFVPISGNPVSPKLIITTATFSASAIYPGDNFTVPIVIQNVGNVPANEVVLSVNATSPLITTGSAGDYRLGTISGNGTIHANLGFSTPTAAPLGSYPIVLTLAYQDNFGNIYTSVQTLVATLVGQPSIVLNTFQFKTNPLTPGLQTFFNAQLLNVGGESALNVKVAFQGAPSFLANSTIFLGSIQPGRTGNATAYLQIPSTIAVGSYQFNVTVTYADSSGRAYEAVSPYTVTVAPFSPPRVSITNTLLSPEVLNPGTQGTLTIYLKNDGASPADSITLKLLNGSKFFSSNLFGLGTLDPSSSGTTTVGVNVSPNLKGGDYLVQIVANYTDDNGAGYSFTLPLEITVYSTTSLLTVKNVGLGLAVAIVGVAVYVGITTRRRGAKAKTQGRDMGATPAGSMEAPLVRQSGPDLQTRREGE